MSETVSCHSSVAPEPAPTVIDPFLNGDDVGLSGVVAGAIHSKAGSDIGLRLGSRGVNGGAKRQSETKNQAYVLHSPTIQKLQK